MRLSPCDINMAATQVLRTHLLFYRCDADLYEKECLDSLSRQILPVSRLLLVETVKTGLAGIFNHDDQAQKDGT